MLKRERSRGEKKRRKDLKKGFVHFGHLEIRNYSQEKAD